MGSKSYEGTRGPKGLLTYVIEDHPNGGTRVKQLLPRTDLVKHTPYGAFECGFKSSGASQLALAILAEHLNDDDRALDLHIGFRDRVIVNLARDRGWCLTQDYIDTHLEALRVPGGAGVSGHPAEHTVA